MSPVPPVPLPAIPAESSATNSLPDFADAGLQVYLDLVADAPSWQDRWLVVPAFWQSAHKSPFEVEATARMISAVGEQLGERTIDCIQAASFYRVSMHPAWQQAAMRWFDAADLDEVSAFLDLNPSFTTFMAQHAGVYPHSESLG